MFWLLALAACTGGTVEKDGGSTTERDPPRARPEVEEEVELPAGRAVAQSCFGGEEEERKQRSGGSPTRAQPTAKPKAQPGGGPFGILGKKGSSRAESAAAPTTTAAPAPPAPPAPSAPDPAPQGEGALGRASTGSGGSSSGLESLGYLGDADDAAPAAEPVAAAEATSAPADKAAAGVSQQERKKDVAKREEAKPIRRPSPPPPPQPSVDWGGVTWLSNDDSMSLASAQRVLYAVKERVSFRASEVRPHELLNYFSFDTAPVEEGQTFSVKGSAERTGEDTLTLALAVLGATPKHQPLDLTLVVDVSGSMEAEGRMDYVKRGLHRASERLVRGDRVNLVIFDHDVCSPLTDYVVGRDEPGMLKAAIDSLEPRGSTDLDLGMRVGYQLANRFVAEDSRKKRNHRVMVLTDAQLNTGDVNPDTVSEVARAYEKDGVRLTGVGVGRQFNDTVLDKLTEKGKGAYVYLGSEAVVDRILGVGFESLTRTIAHDVRFSLDLPDSLGLARFYGEEASSDPEDIQPIHYYAGTHQLFLQDLKVRGSSPVMSDPITLTIHYQDAATGAARTQGWTTTVGEVLSADPHNVRKARALMGWTDFLLARAMGGDPCGNPLSEYRSRITSLGDDAEIAYVNSLTGPLCGTDLGGPVAAGVAWRVRVDSDVPIAEVALSCPAGEQRQPLSASDTVARFNATPGSCTLTLEGAVPMIARVNVPSTGGEARCMVRGGRVSCS